MAVPHDSTFLINDIQLTIPPEQINIQTQASHKEWKPVRIRAPIKAKSGHSVLSIHISVPFVGADEINNKLRPLIAQFRLTPFCFIDNEHLRNTILGGGVENASEAEVRKLKKKNMAMALQNLSVSTIPNEPCTVQADFYFLWFNYLPYTPDFSFKDHPTKRKANGRPGKLWEIFYTPELRKLAPIGLGDSSVYMLTNEYLLSNPQKSDAIVDNKANINELQEFAGDLDEFKNLLASTEAFDGEDGQVNPLGPLGFITPVVQLFRDTENAGHFNRATFNNIVDIVDDAVKHAEQQQGSTAKITENKLKQILKARQDLLLKSAASVGLWLEFPESLLAAENKMSAVNNKKILEFPDQESKLYYRAREMRTNDNLIAEQISVSLSHNLAIIPMAAHQYPTIQYMGGMDIKMSMRLKAVGDSALTDVTTFWNIHHNNILNTKQFPRQYNNVYCKNELLQLFGVDEVILETRNVDTIPSSPGTYDIDFGVCEAGIKPGVVENLKTIPTGRHTARKMLWREIFNLPGEDQDREFVNMLLQYDLERRENAGASGPNPDYRHGIQHHVDKIFENIVNRSGQSKGLTGSLSKTSILQQFNEILALTEDEVYGIEGLQRALWSKLDANRQIIFGKDLQQAKKILDPGLKSYKNRPEVRSYALPEQPAIKVAENIAQDVAANLGVITKALTLLDRNAKRTGWVLTHPSSGESVDLLNDLSDRAFEKLLGLAADDLTPGSPSEKDLSEESLLGILNRANQHEQTDAMRSALEALSDHIRQINSGENPYKTTVVTVKKYFDNWNEFAIRNGEYILESSYINLSMFDEVRKLVELAEVDSFGRVYHDFPLADIREELVKEFPHINLDDGYVVEPDMYFYNHTPDNGLENLVSSDDIEAVRDATTRYAENVYEQNTTWFQQEYLSRMGTDGNGFRKFLESQTNASEPILQIAGGAPASPTLKHAEHPVVKLEPTPLHSVNNIITAKVEARKPSILSPGEPGLYKRGETTNIKPDGVIAEQHDTAGAALGTYVPAHTSGCTLFLAIFASALFLAIELSTVAFIKVWISFGMVDRRLPGISQLWLPRKEK
jgi:hypothetical protein